MDDRLFLPSLLAVSTGAISILSTQDPALQPPFPLEAGLLLLVLGSLGFMLRSTFPITPDASRWHRGLAWAAMKLHLVRRMDCGCYYGSTGINGTKPNHRSVDDPVDEQPHEREYWQRSVDGAEVTYTRMIETLERCTVCGGHFYRSEMLRERNGLMGPTPERHTVWEDEPAPDAVTETTLDVIEE